MVCSFTKAPPMVMLRFIIAIFIPLGFFLSSCTSPSINTTSSLPSDIERVWIGSDFYANRLMDWRYANDRIECIEGRSAKPMRTLHLLTHYLGEKDGTFRMSVRTGALNPVDSIHANTWAGFLIGAGGPDIDWRISSLVHHWPGEDGGLIVGIDGTGEIIVRSNTSADAPKGPRVDIPIRAWPLVQAQRLMGHVPAGSSVELDIHAEPSGDAYDLLVTASDPETNRQIAEARYTGLANQYFVGNVALVSHNSPLMEGQGYWFDDWVIAGSKFVYAEDRAFGPVLSSQYTMNGKQLKMTAQMPPLAETDTRKIRLDLMLDGIWTPSATGDIIPDSYTSTLRVDNLQINSDIPYRLTL